jgi:type II secretory pathway component GspD/PulD (secretin)
MRSLLIAAAALAAAPCWGQEAAPPSISLTGEGSIRLVTLRSRGLDIREVLFDLFDQAGESFMLNPEVKAPLYLSLKEIEFEEALGMILKAARLESRRLNGVLLIDPLPGAAPEPTPEPAGAQGPPAKEPPASEPPAKGEPPKPSYYQLTDEDLKKVRVTLNQKAMPLREVFAEFGRQTQIEIDVMGDVPNYTVDVALNGRPLLQALIDLCRAAKLKFTKSPIRSVYIMRQSEG